MKSQKQILAELDELESLGAFIQKKAASLKAHLVPVGGGTRKGRRPVQARQDAAVIGKVAGNLDKGIQRRNARLNGQ
jgi:hypothetical protein